MKIHNLETFTKKDIESLNSGPKLTKNNNQPLHDESNTSWLYDRLDEYIAL